MKLWIVVYSYQGIVSDCHVFNTKGDVAEHIFAALRADGITDPLLDTGKFWEEFAAWQEKQYQGDCDEEYKIFEQAI